MDLEPLLRMLTAAGLVLPVGLERELRGKAAGLRTHIVVGTASAAFAYVSVLAAPEGSMADQTRIAAQVVSGIGFMGAGVIFASGGRVHGLTTAAALWGAAAIGVCVGLGATSLAVALMLVMLAFLWPIDWVGERLLSGVKLSERTLQVIAPSLAGVEDLQEVLRSRGIDAHEFTVSSFGEGFTVRLVIRCRAAVARELLTDIREHESLLYVTGSTVPDRNA